MRHFIADIHFDHENVLEMSGRPFRNILRHNDHMIEQTNRYVGESDTLYMLGDVGWASIENHLARLTCKNVHLIWGNHDKQSFGKHFKSQQDVLEIKIGWKPKQIKVFMSHYAHAYWPSSHHGAFHIYGHTHRQREDTLDAAFPGRRSIDVGVDNALFLFGEYRPFSENDLQNLLGSRPGHDLPAFYEAFQYNLPKHVEFEQLHLNIPPEPRPLGDKDELKAKAIQKSLGDVPRSVIRNILGQLRDMEEVEEAERIAEIRRNRKLEPELREFGGQSRP